MSQAPKTDARRSFRGAVSGLFRVVTTFAALGVTALLGWVLVSLSWRGIAALSWSTLTGTADVVGGAGLAQAMLGSLLVVVLAFVMAVPLGLVSGAFLSEVGRNSRWLPAVRFVADVLSGMPAIVVGVCVYLLFGTVGLSQSFFAGSVALAALMTPMVACTTSRTLNEVSPALREAAVSLGTPAWRILLQISLRAAAPGILSAGLLAIARVAGEVAPLLLTMPDRSSWALSPSTSAATLHVQAYRYLLSSDPQAQSLAWTAALLLTVGIMSIVFVAHRFGRVVR
jgi:phosphate transport system permease protein